MPQAGPAAEGLTQGPTPMTAIRTLAAAAVLIGLATLIPLLAVAGAAAADPPPPAITLHLADGSTVRYVPETPPKPATLPATVPVVTPPPVFVPPVVVPPVVVPPPVTVDPNTVTVARGADLAALLAKMGDGKTLALERGGDWRGVVIPWRWSRAKLVAVGAGADPVVGGLRAAAAGLADVTVTGGLSVVGPGEVGVDLRQDRLARWTVEDVASSGFEWCFGSHAALLDKAPAAAWLSDIVFRRCRATGARAADPTDTFHGQGAYFSNVNRLTVEDCHGDDCGGLVSPNIFRHFLYVSDLCTGVVVRRCLATRCSSYGLQVRAAGSSVADSVVYDCGMGILLNGASGTCTGNVVVRGHAQGPAWPYGKGAFDLHLGAGVIANNLVLNGPQLMPAGWYTPIAFNVGYRETKVDAKTGKSLNQAWEWLRLDPATKAVRPLAKLGAGNIDRSAVVVTLDPDALLKLPPAEAVRQAMAAVRAAK